MSLLNIPTVGELLQKRDEKANAEREKRVLKQCKEIEEQFHKLENKYSTESIRVEGALEQVLKVELQSKGYVIKYEVDRPSGCDYTYISLPDGKPTKRGISESELKFHQEAQGNI